VGRWRFLPFYLFFVLVVVGASNAVNITDGPGWPCDRADDRFGGRALTVLTYASGQP